MAIINDLLGGTDPSNGDVLDVANYTDTNDALISVGVNTNPSLCPIGTVVAWLKTFDAHDSGTTDGTTSNKLVQSGQNFDVTVVIGDVIHNTTDDTFAYVTAIDSATTLSIDADIMVSGEAYTIYATPALPSGWVECNAVGTISGGPYDGTAPPDMNIVGGAGNLFLRGSISSGNTGGNTTHTHNVPRVGDDATSGSGAGVWRGASATASASNGEPPYYDVVWIMRVK